MNVTKSIWFAALLGVILGMGQPSAHAQTPAAEATRPAYYVAEFQATGPGSIKAYSERVESTFKPYSGRFIVRGGVLDVEEGFGAQGKLVIIKFDSLSQANAWYHSTAYQALIPIRHQAGNTRTYMVEGLPGR